MSKTLNADGTLSIEEYSLVELLPQVIQAHKDGFGFNFDLNDGIPQQYAALTILKMYPVEDEEFSDLDYSPPDQSGNYEDNQIIDVRPVEDVLVNALSPIGVQVETAPNSGVFVKPEVQAPVKVDGRKKK